MKNKQKRGHIKKIINNRYKLDLNKKNKNIKGANMITGKIFKDYGEHFSLKAEDGKVYNFKKIQLYDINFKKIDKMDLTNKEVGFLKIDFNIYDQQMRIINVKDNGYILTDYLQSFSAKVKEFEGTEEELRSKLKEMGAVSLEDFMKMQKEN